MSWICLKKSSEFKIYPITQNKGAESDVEDLPDAKKKEKPKKISQKLSDCVNYIHAVHFHGFSNPER